MFWSLSLLTLQKQGFTPSRQPQQPGGGGKSSRSASKSEQAISKLFNKYDIGETSYHLHSGRIDLHLCEDPSTGNLTIRAIKITLLIKHF